MARHALMGGHLYLFKRPKSRFWQAYTFLGGKPRRKTTKAAGFDQAKDIGEDWYLELRGKFKRGEFVEQSFGNDGRSGGFSFEKAAKRFILEYEALTLGERNPRYVKGHTDRLNAHLLPFFRHKTLAEITPGLVQDYRIHRMTSRKDKDGKPIRPSRSTLSHELVTLRQILKTAQRQGWLESIPDLSMPYKASGKISHRAWFSPDEYKKLYEATRERAKSTNHPAVRRARDTMHDYVLFMGNTGLRPDEAARLEFRDVSVVTDEDTGERILEIEVRGKRGVGYCKSMPGAVFPFQRLKERKYSKDTDLIFGKVKRQQFNEILSEIGLKKDRDGQARTTYSLRHTYICMRLMQGADIYQIAKNCRTSVEMIEKFYASHIKNTLDASAINVRKPKPINKP